MYDSLNQKHALLSILFGTLKLRSFYQLEQDKWLFKLRSPTHFLTHHQSKSLESKPFLDVFNPCICSLMQWRAISNNSQYGMWLGHLSTLGYLFFYHPTRLPPGLLRWKLIQRRPVSQGQNWIYNQQNKVFSAAFVAQYQSSKVKHLPFTVKECLTPTFKGIFKVSCLILLGVIDFWFNISLFLFPVWKVFVLNCWV